MIGKLFRDSLFAGWVLQPRFFEFVYFWVFLSDKMCHSQKVVFFIAKLFCMCFCFVPLNEVVFVYFVHCVRLFMFIYFVLLFIVLFYVFFCFFFLCVCNFFLSFCLSLEHFLKFVLILVCLSFCLEVFSLFDFFCHLRHIWCLLRHYTKI